MTTKRDYRIGIIGKDYQSIPSVVKALEALEQVERILPAIGGWR